MKRESGLQRPKSIEPPGVLLELNVTGSRPSDATTGFNWLPSNARCSASMKKPWRTASWALCRRLAGAGTTGTSSLSGRLSFPWPHAQVAQGLFRPGDRRYLDKPALHHVLPAMTGALGRLASSSTPLWRTRRRRV